MTFKRASCLLWKGETYFEKFVASGLRTIRCFGYSAIFMDFAYIKDHGVYGVRQVGIIPLGLGDGRSLRAGLAHQVPPALSSHLWLLAPHPGKLLRPAD